MMKGSLIILFFFVLYYNACLGQSDGHYYEEHKGGNPNRPLKKEYQKFRKVYDKYTTEEKLKLEALGLKDFTDDNKLMPYPRVLNPDEMKLLEKGVAQRGAALLAFLKDYFSGKKKYEKTGLFPSNVFERIIKRHQESYWGHNLKEEHLNFWYGPDIIRAPADPKSPHKIKFRIVEDNTSFIGGIGDLSLAKSSLLKNVPLYRKIEHSPNPEIFYNELALQYRQRAKKWNGIAVMVIYSPAQASDNEEQRVKKIFEERGVKVVSIHSDTKNDTRYPQIEVDKEGAWLLEKQGRKISRQKIGYMVANVDVSDLEGSHPGNRHFQVLSEAKDALETELGKIGLHAINSPNKKKLPKLKKLLTPDKNENIDIDALEKFMTKEWFADYIPDPKHRGLRGIMDAVLDNKLGLTNPPGFEFINDKEFYLYVDKMIEFYLKEKPLIPSLYTESFAKYSSTGKARLRKKSLQKVFSDIDKWVIKGVAGRGGNAVWVGPKMDKTQIPELIKKIKANPDHYIFQEYSPVSVLDQHIVDLRLHSDIHHRGQIIVSPVPWGRAIDINGDGKVNISLQGKETTVFVQHPKDRKRCKIDRLFIDHALSLLKLLE